MTAPTRRLLTLYSMAALVVSASVLGAQQASRSRVAVVLQPGDAVRIAVWEVPTLSGEFEVSPDSSLRHPIYNRVKVVGVPMETVQARLRSVLQELRREPLIDVTPLYRVAVTGEVRSPGSYLLPAESTVSDAILRAGGVTPQGKSLLADVDRGGSRRRIDTSKLDLDLEWRLVRSGDRIAVPRQSMFVQQYLTPFVALVGAIASVVVLVRR